MRTATHTWMYAWQCALVSTGHESWSGARACGALTYAAGAGAPATCMRPSSFQVLWPWRTITTRTGSVMLGSGSGGASTRSPRVVNASDPCQVDMLDVVAGSCAAAATVGLDGADVCANACRPTWKPGARTRVALEGLRGKARMAAQTAEPGSAEALTGGHLPPRGCRGVASHCVQSLNCTCGWLDRLIKLERGYCHPFRLLVALVMIKRSCSSRPTAMFHRQMTNADLGTSPPP